MSDRIKKIKIKQSDGTFSDYIPIGADAKNIDTTRGESVQSVIDKTARYYDSIAEMKLDDNIQVGDTCVTLGYYEVNDGGGATYKIIDDSSLEDDGGSIHGLNNGLKAQLIIKDGQINIKQFGARSINVENENNINTSFPIDDVFDKSLNFIYNQAIKEKTIGYNFNLLIPAGNYVLMKKHTISPLTHIVACGSVMFYFFNTEDETMFEITTLEQEISPWTRGDVWPRFINPIFDSNNGNFDITNKSGTNINTCFKIGGLTTTSVAEQTCLKNVSIKAFKRGILLYLKNTYMNKFENIRINQCKIGIETSGPENSFGGTNSGENILFSKGTISLCNVAILFDSHITNLKFDNYSFDGNGCVVYQNINITNTVIFDNCWIEAIGNSMGSSHNPISYENQKKLIYIKNYDGTVQRYQISKYILSNCVYVDSTSSYPDSQLESLFYGNTLELFLNNFEYRSYLANSNTTPLYLCDENIKNLYYDNFIVSPYANSPFLWQKNLVQYADFNKEITKTIPIDIDTEISKDFKIHAIENIKSLEIIQDANISKNKVLKITRNILTDSSYIEFMTIFKVFVKDSKLYGRCFVKSNNDDRDNFLEQYKNYYTDLYDSSLSIRSYTNYNTEYYHYDKENFFYPSYIQPIDNINQTYSYATFCYPSFRITFPENSNEIFYLKNFEIFDPSNKAFITK